jgi:hypothetical protein
MRAAGTRKATMAMDVKVFCLILLIDLRLRERT